MAHRQALARECRKRKFDDQAQAFKKAFDLLGSKQPFDAIQAEVQDLLLKVLST